MDANGLNRKNLSQVHGVACGEIMVMNADGTNLVNLTNNPANDYSPAFSPSGSFITFTSLRSLVNTILPLCLPRAGFGVACA